MTPMPMPGGAPSPPPPAPPGVPPAPPPGAGGMSSGPLAGSSAQGMSKVKVGLEALQAALPMIPMGSELHADVMKAVSSISKHMGEAAGAGGGGGAQIQQLVEMIRNAKMQGQPPQAGMMPGGAGAPPPPPPPGGAPPMGGM